VATPTPICVTLGCDAGDRRERRVDPQAEPPAVSRCSSADDVGESPVRDRMGIRQRSERRSVEPVDVFNDVLSGAVGPRRFFTDLHKAVPFEHPVRADVVLRSSRVERSLRLVRDEESHGSRGDAAPPPRWIDPVGQLTVTLQREACDHADKRAVLVDRTRSVLRVGSHALVVSLKRRPVSGVGTGESRHAGRHPITLPSEEIVEIVIIERAESDRHNCQPIQRDRQCSAARMRILWRHSDRADRGRVVRCVCGSP
jgi:hypothetical protein